MTDLTFEKPGPGTWELEDGHFTRPFSRWMQTVFPPAMSEGFGQSMAHYGTLLDAPKIEPIHGFIYASFQPVVGPAEADGPPPKLLFALMKRLHPTLRRRLRRMAETFETKRWRDDLERWDETWMPERVAENQRLQDIDPDALSDAELADHLEEVRTTVHEGIVLHHRMDLCPLFPMGDFLAHATEWTDRSAGELLGLFRGASPISAGAIEELRTLVAAIRDHPDARATLDGDDPAETIVETLRARSDPVGSAMAAWLDVVGYRIFSGYDVADAYILEEPSVAVATIRTAVEKGVDAPTTDEPPAELGAVRSEVPSRHREQFDELYEEARLTYRVRDERSLTDLWTIGLARRALLAAGRRFDEDGRLHAADHAVDLTPDEVVDGLRGEPMPTADAVSGYVEHRHTHGLDDAPARLGPDPAPPPPAEWLPEPSARGLRAVTTMMDHLMGTTTPRSGTDVIRGVGVGDGSVEGRATIVAGPADFSTIEEGDVLVAPVTSPAYNVVLPMLAGVVTDHGGALSHAAIVAREYDIPAVVDSDDATDRLENGMRVVVDGAEGTVRIVD